jgi:hypothetical protein
MSDAVGGLETRKRLAGLLACLSVSLAGCDISPKAVAIQNAKPGDLLVSIKGSRVELVRAFTPGVANGLYKGIVKVTPGGGDTKNQIYEVTAICSMNGEPGWPTYDNIYGDSASEPNTKKTYPGKDRWQFLFHFDGRTEKTGTLEPSDWVSHLKDNLCRKGDFDDT